MLSRKLSGAFLKTLLISTDSLHQAQMTIILQLSRNNSQNNQSHKMVASVNRNILRSPVSLPNIRINYLSWSLILKRIKRRPRWWRAKMQPLRILNNRHKMMLQQRQQLRRLLKRRKSQPRMQSRIRRCLSMINRIRRPKKPNRPVKRLLPIRMKKRIKKLHLVNSHRKMQLNRLLSRHKLMSWRPWMQMVRASQRQRRNRLKRWLNKSWRM
jgi:hypothetical protein